MVNLKDQLIDKEKVVITAALPYANGTIHIGHLLEYIQADIYSRFLKLIGKDALYICASDMHGTPIEINAKKAGVKPEDFVEKYWVEHQQDFSKFLINFDNFHRTHSDENKELAELFFTTLKEKGYIYLKEIEQYYDEEAKQFLPDRFIKGTCPKCNSENQYGDNCESCGAIYSPTDLINPKSTLSGSKPILRKTTHYFFKLRDFSVPLKAWINDPKSTIQPEMKNWLNNWLEQGLKDWCISRDEPYFGFEIPGCLDETGEKKYFYVWMDAPIGYISSTMNYLSKLSNNSNNGIDDIVGWQDYWKSEDSQVIHIIGKDIAYFHYLFWPAMLTAMEIPLPILNTHGFITVNGTKMSKSRGTFFTAKDFHELYGGEKLRFYYANSLNRKLLDLDLNFEDFKAVSNNVLMGNLGNFCFRTLSFASKNFETGFDGIAKGDNEEKLMKEFWNLVDKPHGIKDSYYNLDYKSAIKQILNISDMGNVYFQKLEPWKKRESVEDQKVVASKICFMVNLVRNLSVLIKPVMPDFSAKIEKSFGVEAVLGNGEVDGNSVGTGLSWDALGFDWDSSVKLCDKLVEKVQLVKKEESIVSKDNNNEGNNKKDKNKQDNKTKSVIVVPENCFGIDIRVGKIVSVIDHPNAEKLYIFKVDFGEIIGERQIIAGLKKYYSSEELVGKKTLFCINLKPAKLRGELSNGMSLVAEESEEDSGKLTLLWVDDDVELGEQANFEGFEVFDNEIDFNMFEKFPLIIQNGKVFWEKSGKNLIVAGKELVVKDISDSAKVC